MGLLKSTGVIIFAVYFIGVTFFAEKYLHEDAKKSSFWSWAIFGETTAGFKALAWPYYEIIKERKKVPSKQELEHFNNAIDYIQKAFAKEEEISNKQQGVNKLMAENDFKEINALKHLALEEAYKVNYQALSLLNTELPTHFKQQFIGGLEKYMQGVSTDNFHLLNEGTLLLNQFGDWYRSEMNR
jgi:hypothetical protein